MDDGPVAAAEAHRLQGPAVELAGPREAADEGDVEAGAPLDRGDGLERVEGAPAHLEAERGKGCDFLRSAGDGERRRRLSVRTSQWFLCAAVKIEPTKYWGFCMIHVDLDWAAQGF